MAKNLVLWLIIATVLLMVFQNFSPKASQENLSYSEFVSEVQSDRVKEVTIQGQTVRMVVTIVMARALK